MTSALSCDGIELGFDRVRPGRDLAQRKGRREHLNEDGFHEIGDTRGAASPMTIIQKGNLTVWNLKASHKIFRGSRRGRRAIYL